MVDKAAMEATGAFQNMQVPEKGLSVGVEGEVGGSNVIVPGVCSAGRQGVFLKGLFLHHALEIPDGLAEEAGHVVETGRGVEPAKGAFDARLGALRRVAGGA